MANTKAVFIDRDGVILKLFPDVKFIYRKEQIVILPGVLEALRQIKKRAYLLIVVSNQSAIADGVTTVEEVKEFHRFLNDKLDGIIDHFYFCPHHPKQRDDIPSHAKKYRIMCTCRKPAPGMLFQAAKDFNIDLSQSWLVGDLISDIAAGDAAGCRTILIPSAHSGEIITTAQPFNTDVKPTFYADNLADTVKFF